MIRTFALIVVTSALAACSESPEVQVPETESEAEELEKQVQEEAQSLTEAADEAVKLLEAEIAEETPSPPPSETVTEDRNAIDED